MSAKVGHFAYRKKSIISLTSSINALPPSSLRAPISFFQNFSFLVF